MRDLKWYYLVSIFVGVIALVGVVIWLMKTTDIITKITDRDKVKVPDSL